MKKAGTNKYGQHPLVQYVRSLPQEFYLPREVAEQLGCSLRMLAYLRTRSSEPVGPTHQAQYGGIVLYLYTPERIAEIAECMKKLSGEGNRRRGPALLWTRTELTNRRRMQNRVINCRHRAADLREQGREKDAVKQDKLVAGMVSRLEKSKIQRWEKVHGMLWSQK